MGKAIKIILVAILVSGIIVFVVLYLSVNSIVKSGIEEVGTEMTGTRVTVDRVSISPFSGRGQITGFRVANPEGYTHDYVFVVDDFHVELDLFSLFTDEVVVKRVIITAPAIYVEQKLPENNIYSILRNIRDTLPGEVADAELLIEYFLMTDGSTDLYTEIGGERSARVEISTIELTDLSSGDGRRAVENVIREIAEEIAEEALKAAAQSGVEQLRDAIRDFFD